MIILDTDAGSLTISRNTQNGLITATTLGSTATSQSYNGFAELSQYTANYSGSSIFDVQYIRDALGRITQKTETVAGVTDTYSYSYDLAGRLTAVAKNGVTISQYSYDSNSNRISYTNANGTVSATYDNQDRLLTYGNNSYIYSANGELQSKTSNAGTTTYSYDVLGNLLSVTLSDGTLIEYVTDGQNRRIGKKVNGSLVQGFLYESQLRPAAELDGTGAVVSRFVYATKINVPDYMVKNGVTYRIITDQLGSPRFIIDTSTGALAQELDYDEFGNIIFDTNPGFQPFGFAGGLYDQHTKLTKFGFRDYDAEAGRWTAKDPIKFYAGDTNLYGYVLNDPINWMDIIGLRAINSCPGGLNGPSITFNNNNGGPNVNPNVSDETADMIERVVRETGVDININSTTAGNHGPNSRHQTGQAVDINEINGNPVNASNSDANALQDAFSRDPNIRENFGPNQQTKTDSSGNRVNKPDQAGGHQNHIHVSGQR